jgi:hypothetical protein
MNSGRELTYPTQMTTKAAKAFAPKQLLRRAPPIGLCATAAAMRHCPCLGLVAS